VITQNQIPWTDFDYPFGIFKLFLEYNFVLYTTASLSFLCRILQDCLVHQQLNLQAIKSRSSCSPHYSHANAKIEELENFIKHNKAA
jgi:5-carboxymethyl-2-hydroxymuconate isomerase